MFFSFINRLRAGKQGDSEDASRFSVCSTPEKPLISLVARLTASGNFDAAVALIENACRIHPEDPDFHFSRGVTLEAWRQPMDALEAFETTLKLQPGHKEAAESCQRLRSALPGRRPHKGMQALHCRA